MAIKQDTKRRSLPAGGNESCSPVGMLRTEEAPDELDDAQERCARMCKAMAHPARVRIVRLLLCVETCVCGDIVDKLPLAQSTVRPAHQGSQGRRDRRGHTIDGPRTCYCLDRETLAEFKALPEALL